MDLSRWYYHRQPDPEDPRTPLAWVFERNGRRVGNEPPSECGHYREVEIRKTHERWYVHCSFAGALEFLWQTLGEENIEINEETSFGALKVPQNMASFWIGRRGSMVGFLKGMFGLRKLEIVPTKNWHRHRRK